MSKTIEIPEELAKRLCPIVFMPNDPDVWRAREELRALLAASVVERQAKPIYQVRYIGDGGGGWVDVEKDEFTFDKGRKDYHTRTVFDSPPAPVAVVLPKDPEKSFLEWASTLPSPPRCLQSYLAAIDKVKELNQ